MRDLYKRYFEDILEEECPEGSKAISSGACARIDANGNLGAKIMGRCHTGYTWDSSAGKCVSHAKK